MLVECGDFKNKNSGLKQTNVPQGWARISAKPVTRQLPVFWASVCTAITLANQRKSLTNTIIYIKIIHMKTPTKSEQPTNPRVRFTIITLFPEALQPYLNSSMLYKAQDRGIIAIDYVNLRDYGLGPHKSVDDTPYGGGDGMLLRPEPVFAAVESVKAQDDSALVILPTPVGKTWDQQLARQFAGVDNSLSNIAEKVRELSLRQEVVPDEAGTEADAKHYIIICPHYEGYDERIMQLVDYPISLGNYVLTGGELAALIIVDSVTRLLPGVLGGDSSAAAESFADEDCQNLEYPQYTKPAEFRGMSVPEVLLSGNHGEIAKWRTAHSNKKQN